MKKKNLIAVGIATALFLGAGSASAAVITLKLSNALFQGGNTTNEVSGKFSYDTVADTYSNWDLSSKAVSSTINNLTGGLGASTFNYNVKNSVVDVNNLYTYKDLSPSIFAVYSTSATSLPNDLLSAVYPARLLTLMFSQALNTLTTVGQTVKVVYNLGQAQKGSNDATFTGNGGNQQNALKGGLITVSSVTTPIPGAVWLFGTGIAGLLGAKRRKTAAAVALQA